MEKKRNSSIDVCRGIAILYVILCHLEIPEELNAYIYSFHVPVLLMISGMLFKSDYSFWDFFYKKFRGIILPLLFLRFPIIVLSVFENIKAGTFSKGFLLNTLYSSYIEGDLGVFWYLEVLLWINILVYFIDKIINRKIIKIIISLIIFCIGIIYTNYIGIILPWRIELTLTAQIFFCFGYYFKDELFSLKLLKNNKKSLFILIAIHLLLLYITYFKFGYIVNVDLTRYGNVLLSVLMMLVGSVIYIFFSSMVKSKTLTYIGKNSIIYYAWHFTMFTIVESIINHMGINVGNNLMLFYKFVGSIIICTICTFIVNHTKLRFFIGR